MKLIVSMRLISSSLSDSRAFNWFILEISVSFGKQKKKKSGRDLWGNGDVCSWMDLCFCNQLNQLAIFN